MGTMHEYKETELWLGVRVDCPSVELDLDDDSTWDFVQEVPLKSPPPPPIVG